MAGSAGVARHLARAISPAAPGEAAPVHWVDAEGLDAESDPTQSDSVATTPRRISVRKDRANVFDVSG